MLLFNPKRGDTTSVEEDRMKKIEEILLKHKGKKNAIYARDIAKAVGIQDNDTFVNTRTLIRKLMKRKQLPIGANEKWGYFIIANQKELDDYIKTLERREKGITDRKIRAMVYFENYYNTDLAEKEEFDENDKEDII